METVLEVYKEVLYIIYSWLFERSFGICSCLENMTQFEYDLT